MIDSFKKPLTSKSKLMVEYIRINFLEPSAKAWDQIEILTMTRLESLKLCTCCRLGEVACFLAYTCKLILVVITENKLVLFLKIFHSQGERKYSAFAVTSANKRCLHILQYDVFFYMKVLLHPSLTVKLFLFVLSKKVGNTGGIGISLFSLSFLRIFAPLLRI